VDIVNPEIDRYLQRPASPDDPIPCAMGLPAAERFLPIAGLRSGRLRYPPAVRDGGEDLGLPARGTAA